MSDAHWHGHGPLDDTGFLDVEQDLGEGGPRHWPSLTGSDAEQAWQDLHDWVERLVDRFALDPRPVPPCWFRHNAMVEVLAALRDHERASYAPDAPGTEAVDWLRALGEAEHRLAECAARTQCSVTEHRDDPARMWHTDAAEWADFVSRDVACRGEADLSGPRSD
ncbi:MAG TPA: hypothetical protein VFX16_16850 [Pseudonocardiaceae bacterium]|nr:hypothetical protein [Pseudonocardiaceae bacterium]